MKYLLSTFIFFLLFISNSCTDKNQPFGKYEYELINETLSEIDLLFYEQSSQNLIYQFSLESISDTAFSMNWSENKALGYPFYTAGSDSAVIIFDNVKILKYELSNQLINDKNLYIIDTYDKETLSSERRNEENIKFTFVFTAQDYAVADTL